MNIWFLLKLYGTTLAAFLIIDLTWLGLIARGFYAKHLGHLMAARTNWSAAIVFYLLFVLGVIIFAVLPGLEADSLPKALLWGALYGFFTYATYDLTNLATLRNWPVLLTIVDIAWGVFLATSVSAISFWIGNWMVSQAGL
jgi:uncharacterized membrane protein